RAARRFLQNCRNVSNEFDNFVHAPKRDVMSKTPDQTADLLEHSQGLRDGQEMSSLPGLPGLVVVLNSSIAVGFLQGQLEFLQNRGFAVTVLCPGRRSDEWEVSRPDGVAMRELPMERAIAPLRDLVSLWKLWRAMRALRPVVTNVGTPKAGLLG